MSELPYFSCICVTAGRVAQLSEAVACYQRQSYEGESELVVLNTLPEQELVCNVPCVSVYNLMERAPSLGEARNWAIGLSKGSHCLIFDDDDIYLPNHLSNFAKHFNGQDWLWLNRQMYMVGGQIKSIVAGSANLVGFTKKAWESIGGYNSKLSVGEDREFVGKLTSQKTGRKVEISPADISFLYAWGQGVWHISGMGDDKKPGGSAWRRADFELRRRIQRKQIPTGLIQVIPKLERDYEAMAKAFVSQKTTPAPRQNQAAIVLLGKYGDICSLLPVAKHINDTYGKPAWIVSRQFASILEGVSYVDPVIVENNFLDTASALTMAQERFTHVINAQAYGRGVKIEHKTAAYNHECWKLAGFGHKFEDNALRPVFDLRNPLREQALFNKLNIPDKPMLLYKLSGGGSSPFTGGNEVLQAITDRFGVNFNLIDLSTIRAERIFDIIGLFDRAAALLTVDTATLHLAAASTVPIVALTNPQNWLGTLPRGRCVARMTYSEAMEHPESVLASLESAMSMAKASFPPVSPLPPIKSPRIFMTVERHREKPDRRKEIARKSWAAIAKQGVTICELWKYPRSAKALKDRRDLPYVKDVLANAMSQAGDNDIIFLVNDDVYLHPQLPDALKFYVSVYGPVCSQRCEFIRKPFLPDNASPQAFAAASSIHPGRDLFAFTKRWLVEHWDEIGDSVLACSEWDFHFACLIRLQYGLRTNSKNIQECIFPADLPRGYLAHQYHQPKWQAPEMLNKSPGNLHNRKLLRAFTEKHGLSIWYDKFDCPLWNRDTAP